MAAARQLATHLAAAYVAPRRRTLLHDVARRQVAPIAADQAHPICCDAHARDAAARHAWDAAYHTARWGGVAPAVVEVAAWADDAPAWRSEQRPVRCFLKLNTRFAHT